MNQPAAHVTPETVEYTNLAEGGLIEKLFETLGSEIHYISAAKGFYPNVKSVHELVEELVGRDQQDAPSWVHNRDDLIGTLTEFATHARETMDRNEGEVVALEQSELSECLEGIRAGNPPDDKLKEFSSAEIELADAVIRICDHANWKKYRLGAAVRAKIAYNRTRPPKHGKKF